ncbi:MAG: hypothetical protein H2184_13325 [Candidatus Galacturonibacter soehngenii]|nr:hypothetical protein [Candidatus Galacturonibacter soehngenii]
MYRKKIKRERSEHLILPDMLANGEAMRKRKLVSEENNDGILGRRIYA